MRWEDERYVRLYTKDTATWKLLCWQAKCLLPLLLRKVDRAGIAEAGEPVIEGIAALTDLPPDLVESGLRGDGGRHGLLTREVCVIRGPLLIVPNFLDAQEARQSDAARQRAHRERARDLARAGLDPPPTAPVLEASQNVTTRHAPSQPVTPSLPILAVPGLAVPGQEEEEKRRSPGGSAPRGAGPGAAKVTRAKQLTLADAADPAPELSSGPMPAPSTATWEAYAAAYEERYGAAPVRNASVNAKLLQLVRRLGAEAAPQVAAFYVRHTAAYYVTKGHAVGPLVQDAEKLHTEWSTGRQINSQTARLEERTAANAFRGYADELRQRQEKPHA